MKFKFKQIHFQAYPINWNLVNRYEIFLANIKLISLYIVLDLKAHKISK